MISQRQGFGDLLAEGVKRASEKLGGEAAECADLHHEGRLAARPRSPGALGGDARHVHVVQRHHGERQPPFPDGGGAARRASIPFDGEEVAKLVGMTAGRRNFEDSLGVCIFTIRTRLENSAARSRPRPAGTTVWRRRCASAAARPRSCAPSTCAAASAPTSSIPSNRYGSQPVDGPAKGHDVREQWDRMLEVWYETVGYDRKTGKPKKELLRSLDLDWLAKDLYGKK